MNKAFREYHYIAGTDRTKLWKDSFIVLDTNVFLDFYSYGKDTLDDYFNVLKEAKKRNQLWMPHRVGFEFFERRIGIISRQLNVYDSILNYLNNPGKTISNLTNSSGVHAHLDYEDISSKYTESVKSLVGEIEKLKMNHPDHLGNDNILESLEEIYTDSLVGEPYSPQQISELIKEGEERYAKHIPPGFRDDGKTDDENKPDSNRKYGDLIIWKQILEKAKTSNKSIIFVTNDAKDDWVQYAKDKRRLGPKPALRKEIINYANVDFDLYSSDEFLKSAKEYLGVSLRTGSVEEVQKYRKLENERQMEVASISEDRRSRELAFPSLANNTKKLEIKIEFAIRLCQIIETSSFSRLLGPPEVIEILNRQSSIYTRLLNDISHTNYTRIIEYEDMLSSFDLSLREFAPNSATRLQRLLDVNQSIIYNIRRLMYRNIEHPWINEDIDQI
jgi:hypothetical protein